MATLGRQQIQGLFDGIGQMDITYSVLPAVNLDVI